MLALAVGTALAFNANVHVRPAALSLRSAASPTMQFWKKDSGAAPKQQQRRSGEFFDDEYDSYNTQPWSPDFAENGEVDLANVGGVYYLALVPFVLFFLSYAFGMMHLRAPTDLG